ncbi:MAG: hypothetical protein H0U74_18490 [Bradymonadaceae bacterium]|nr:hypothetical protein [Lujinxingiaceae bacterium]
MNCPNCNERNPSTAAACLHCNALLSTAPAKAPLYSTRTMGDGSVEVRGPLATLAATVIILGFATVGYLLFTGKIEVTPSTTICVDSKDRSKIKRLQDQGYRLSHRDNLGACPQSCFKPPATETATETAGSEAAQDPETPETE